MDKKEERIKLIVDSGCDISIKQAKKYQIDVLPISIIWNGKVYRDFYDFDCKEFYKMMHENEELPNTSQVTPEMFLAAFHRAKEEGYKNIISISLNSNCSGIYQSSVIARDMFMENVANRDMRIEVFDSANYSYMYGAVVIDTAREIKKGTTVDELIPFIKDKIARVEGYAVIHTLDFLKRTGRISRINGIIGDVLDIKPILYLGDGELVAVDKVRGRHRSITRMIENVKRRIDPDQKEIFLMVADMEEEEKDTVKQLKELMPNVKTVRSNVGSVIATHAGPHIIGIGYYRRAEDIKKSD